MSTITAYPLSWPSGWKRTQRENIRRSRFGTWKSPPSIAKALGDITHELRLLGAREVVVSTNVELREDGWPRSTSKRIDDAGVAVYFTLNKQPRVLACDRWLTVGENLYAVAMHVSALRGQERWGVGTLDQAFTGYAALPAQSGEHWTAVLGLTLSATAEEINTKYRKLLLDNRLHPDQGGDGAEFQRVTAARDAALSEISGGLQ